MFASVVAVLVWAVLGSTVQVIPPGTALPISLDCTLDAKKVKPGQVISGTIAQDVPLGDRGKIREGSHVIGHVVAAGRNADGSSYIRIRFDQLRAKHWADVPIMTYVRAMATPREVDDAQLPKVGPMINPLPAYWGTTYQIGGDAVWRGGGPVMHGQVKIGTPVPGGALVRLVSVDQPGCRVENGGPEMAVWVFGSAACGPYGFFDELEIGHAGDNDPLGEIVLRSDKNVHVPTGTAMLLIAAQPRKVLVVTGKVTITEN